MSRESVECVTHMTKSMFNIRLAVLDECKENEGQEIEPGLMMFVRH